VLRGAVGAARAVGALKAGTLLFSGTFIEGTTAVIQV
jgi:hypothetical protein